MQILLLGRQWGVYVSVWTVFAEQPISVEPLGQCHRHIHLKKLYLSLHLLALVQLGILVMLELLIMPFYSSCTQQRVFTELKVLDFSFCHLIFE